MRSPKLRAGTPVPPFSRTYSAPLDTKPLRKDQENTLHEELAAVVRNALDEAWCPGPLDSPGSKPAKERRLETMACHDGCTSITDIRPRLVVLAARLEKALQAAAERRASATGR